MNLTFTQMNQQDTLAILEWRYEDPYSFYNFQLSDFQGFLLAKDSYYSIADEQGNLVGFCCFGAEAQVPGGDYVDKDALDVGIGLRPDLTGKGMGLQFLYRILEFAESKFSPAVFRLTVATFNQRAIRVYQKAGFKPGKVFINKTNEGEFEFLQMLREA